MSSKMRACTQRGPKRSAFLVPAQEAGGWGGFQRKSPTGGAA
jgi:hypothetical protein